MLEKATPSCPLHGTVPARTTPSTSHRPRQPSAAKSGNQSPEINRAFPRQSPMHLPYPFCLQYLFTVFAYYCIRAYERTNERHYFGAPRATINIGSRALCPSPPTSTVYTAPPASFFFLVPLLLLLLQVSQCAFSAASAPSEPRGGRGRRRRDGGNAGAVLAGRGGGGDGGRRPRSGRVHRRRLAERARHVLRRQRRLGDHGRRVRVRQPVQPGVRREQRGAEHGAVRRGAELRRVLRDPVREPARVAVVPPGEPLHPRHRHQLLPAQLRAPLRRRRLVQPAAPALRPRHAHVPPHRRVPRRHRPRLLPPGAVPQVRRGAVHHERVPVLQPGADHERGGRRRRGARQREGVVEHHRVDAHVAQLGPELAVQRHPRRPGALLPRHRQRPPHLHLVERRPARLAVRPDVRGQELQGLTSHAFEFEFFLYVITTSIVYVVVKLGR